MHNITHLVPQFKSHLYAVHTVITNEALTSESRWYNHCIWCGGNSTTLFKKSSHGGTTVTSGMEEI